MSNQKSKVADKVDFGIIRYAQCWEDADLLTEALAIREGDTVLSICSAGDNSFALLAQGPAKVYAIDLSFQQICCAELRKAMYAALDYEQFLLFGGVIAGDCPREAIYQETLRPALPATVAAYWDHNLPSLRQGFMAAGKFEGYFALFRTRVLPLIHSRRRVDALLTPKSAAEREAFYQRDWCNLRWQWLFRLFFSRAAMGKLGRDKEFFRFVEGSVADRILARTRHALTMLDPSVNPYLQYILHGHYVSEDAMPFALRQENYARIRENLSRIEFVHGSIEALIEQLDTQIDAFNLSDIFEYMSQEDMDVLYARLLQQASTGARFAYWNMLAPRACSEALAERYGVMTDRTLNQRLLASDKAFFYSSFYKDVKTGGLD